MPKESGLSPTLTVDDSATAGKAITNDVLSFVATMPRNVQDVTGLDKAAHERLQLLADGTFDMAGVFNDEANLSHVVFKDSPTTIVGRTIVMVHSSQTLTTENFIGDYAMTRAADGSLTWNVPTVLMNGTAPTWS